MMIAADVLDAPSPCRAPRWPMSGSEQEAAVVAASSPVVFDVDGTVLRASLEPGGPFRYPAERFITGRIGGDVVRLSAEQEALFLQGCEPREGDVADRARLREAFGGRTDF